MLYILSCIFKDFITDDIPQYWWLSCNQVGCELVIFNLINNMLCVIWGPLKSFTLAKIPVNYAALYLAIQFTPNI